MKLLKSEDLNKELYKTEKDMQTVDGTGLQKLAVKVLVLIAKLIRDLRHNQVKIGKKMGVNFDTNPPVKKEEGENSEKDA